MNAQHLFHHSRVLRCATILLCAALIVGCQDTQIPVAPDVDHATEIAAKKPGDGGGVNSLMGDVIVGDGPAGSIASTCPGSTGHGGWHLNFDDTGCLIVTPVGSAYSLTDAVRLVVTKEKGKNGQITHVRLIAQDDNGILHDTEDIPVAVPVVPDKNGFTVHVHAQDVDVWQLSEGERVAVIGTISIGDMVYFVQ